MLLWQEQAREAKARAELATSQCQDALRSVHAIRMELDQQADRYRELSEQLDVAQSHQQSRVVMSQKDEVHLI